MGIAAAKRAALPWPPSRACCSDRLGVEPQDLPSIIARDSTAAMAAGRRIWRWAVRGEREPKLPGPQLRQAGRTCFGSGSGSWRAWYASANDQQLPQDPWSSITGICRAGAWVLATRSAHRACHRRYCGSYRRSHTPAPACLPPAAPANAPPTLPISRQPSQYAGVVCCRLRPVLAPPAAPACRAMTHHVGGRFAPLPAGQAQGWPRAGGGWVGGQLWREYALQSGGR